MEDTLEQPTSEPLATEQVLVTPEPTVQPKLSGNLIQNNKRLSLLAQIYNWQPTCLSIRITLPIEPRWNRPLFAIEVSPYFIPLSYFVTSNTTWGGRRIHSYLDAKSWHFVANRLFAANINLDYTDNPANVHMIEKDNMPDITWMALNHAAWSGEIDFMFRCISNVTTQGKLSFSRIYNVERSSLYFNASNKSSLIDYSMTSMTSRKKNSFMILDISRTTDLQINCPYIDIKPMKRSVDRLSNPTRSQTGEPSSYILVDIVDALASSAGSNELILDLWIKAGPDFKLHQPMPPRYDDLLQNVAGWPNRFCDRAPNFAPSIIGPTNGNVAWLSPDLATIPTDNPS